MRGSLQSGDRNFLRVVRRLGQMSLYRDYRPDASVILEKAGAGAAIDYADYANRVGGETTHD